ncbi:haloacid dehalogenase-like hydrolase [Pseudoruegeria aquimaris]|uniref:Haloacid dehalogenase-like hydrolase n=1 Tax=Pseudoruegeria aquimaris TaxID=393663 RepID=A0A1Y5SH56_9RHOB|nr:HAD family hydrolase [Pseudoruegeria aquimaris]SLN37582.1 haloacid dehalogenase-like hydrolase [Pseudoruegeria aquimaris]
MRLALIAAGLLAAAPALADPLPSWNDTETKSRIIAFVESVTDPSADTFVPVKDRIATFDNDGNLWAEQPVYFQLIFAIDRVAELAKADPSIAQSEAMKAAAAQDYKAVLASGEDGLIEVLAAAHTGVDTETFIESAADWLATARHPQTGLLYKEMTYQPMVELLRYLRDEDFQTFIVSGGGIHFVRAYAEEAYGIPPQNVVGTQTVTTYETAEDGTPRIIKQPEIFFIDDKAGKPVGIDNHIGKRPILASGNSDGDFAMLEYTTAGEGPRLGILLHHTDAEREFAYDREGHVGVLNRGLDEAEARGWLVIDMARDWGRIYTGKPKDAE